MREVIVLDQNDACIMTGSPALWKHAEELIGDYHVQDRLR
jgi:hypothetical protein